MASTGPSGPYPVKGGAVVVGAVVVPDDVELDELHALNQLLPTIVNPASPQSLSISRRVGAGVEVIVASVN